MFEKHSTEDYTRPLPGIQQKTLVFGERTLMTEFLLTENSILPDHAHPYEQTGYLVKGHIVLRVGPTEHDTTPGDSWCIPMNVTHGARVLEDSIAIEVFSPARADYLPNKEKMRNRLP
jgi:quercetin dioxygenase-like cupin family protein